VEELVNRFEGMITLNFFLEKVLDCFDIVIGGFLDILDPLRIFDIEVFDYAIEQCFGFMVERGYFGTSAMASLLASACSQRTSTVTRW